MRKPANKRYNELKVVKISSDQLSKEFRDLLVMISPLITDMHISETEYNLDGESGSNRYRIIFSEANNPIYSTVNRFKYKNLRIILFNPKPSCKCIAFQLADWKDSYLGFVAPARETGMSKSMERIAVQITLEDSDPMTIEQIKENKEFLALVQEFMKNPYKEIIKSESTWRRELEERRTNTGFGISTPNKYNVGPAMSPYVPGMFRSPMQNSIAVTSTPMLALNGYDDPLSTLPKLSANSGINNMPQLLVKLAREYYILEDTDHAFSKKDICEYLSSYLMYLEKPENIQLVMDFLKQAYKNYRNLGGKN